MLKKFFVPVLVMLLTSAFCSKSEKYSVFHQVTGLGETNTYLLYDERSKEAALFDVGGPIDKLESIIKEKELDLKYIFITHCHWDHVYGVPDIKKKYPDELPVKIINYPNGQAAINIFRIESEDDGV